MTGTLTARTRNLLLRYQRTERLDHKLYQAAARREKDIKNRQILMRIAADEADHAAVWETFCGQIANAHPLRYLWYGLVCALLGYTFTIRFMMQREYLAGQDYERLLAEIPEAEGIVRDEKRHERELAGLLNEERLRYVGAMVLGLNDALVELTGTIAGLTFALAHTRLVALSGIITGVSATLSMAASNYLAQRADENPNALKSSVYTGVAYLATVVILVLPYLLLPDHLHLVALALMLTAVLLIILLFNYYISVAQSLPFAKRFGEMACISLGVAVISFGIGLLAKGLLGIDV